MLPLKNITLGEFKRLAQEIEVLEVTAQQQISGHYSLFAIDTNAKQIYSIRHARRNWVRSWRLNSLFLLLKKSGITHFEVIHLNGQKSIICR